MERLKGRGGPARERHAEPRPPLPPRQRRAFSTLGGPVELGGEADAARTLGQLYEVEASLERALTHGFHSYAGRMHPSMARGAITVLESGKRIPADTVMYSAGRQGMTDGLQLEAAGLAADHRGRIKVDEHYRTEVPHIYAVGDVIGFPSLAATSMEQGRLAAHHACGEPVSDIIDLQPIGIYTIPEISFVGRTEDALTEAKVPFEVGVSRYRELARGQIIGDSYGMLKLLVSPDDRKLLGVHVFGTGATELVHIGQTVMGLGGTVDYLVNAVFNYPTLAESYKVAALDAMNKMRHMARLTE